MTNPVKDRLHGIFVTLTIDEGNALVGWYCVKNIEHGLNKVAQNLNGNHFACFEMELDKGKFGASINSHEPIEFSLGPVHFGEDGYGNS